MSRFAPKKTRSSPYFPQQPRIMRIFVNQNVAQTARNLRKSEANACYYNSRYAITRILIFEILENNRTLCLFAPPKSVAALDKIMETGSPRTASSANESVHFAYILSKAETSRGMWRSFSPLRTGENRLTPDSLDSASILSVRSKNGSLQRPTALQAGIEFRGARVPV